LISDDEWTKRILQFFVDRSTYRVYKVTRKEEVLESFGSHLDDNAYVAFLSLEKKGLILHYTSNGDDFYTIDLFEKKDQIKKILEDENLDTKSEMMQPDESETEGLEYQFTTRGYRAYPTQSSYYYYTKKVDDSYWLALHKTKPATKAHRIILGSFKDPESRIYRIWKATLKIANENYSKAFLRKRVEDVEQKACGNNRLPSKAAFDVFIYKKWLLKEMKGKKTFYKLNKVKLKKKLLEESTEEVKEKQQLIDKNDQ